MLAEKMIDVSEIEEQVSVIRWVGPLIVEEEGLLIGFDRDLEVPLFSISRFKNLEDVTEGLVEILGLSVDADGLENKGLRFPEWWPFFKVSEGEAQGVIDHGIVGPLLQPAPVRRQEREDLFLGCRALDIAPVGLNDG